MATEKILNTRIQLKYDTLSNWNASTFNLKKGEIAIAEIVVNKDPSDQVEGSTLNPVMFKVGVGDKKFSELDWASAKAADVYGWAKKSQSEFESYVKGLINEGPLTAYYTKTEIDALLKAITDAASALAGRVAILEGKYDVDKNLSVIIQEINAAIAAVDTGVMSVSGKDAIAVTTGKNPEVSLVIDPNAGNVELSQSATGLKAEVDLSNYALSEDIPTEDEIKGLAATEINRLIAASDDEGGETIQNIANLVDYVEKNGGQITGLVTDVNNANAIANAASTTANEAKTTAGEAKTTAGEAKDLAQQAMTAASDAQTGAAASAAAAAESADAASDSADAASESAAAALASEGAAKTAQTAAETAQGLAEDAQEAAETAQTGAEQAKAAASASEANAKTSETNAKTSETAAKTSETNAASSASDAAGSASDAATSAEAAGNAQTAAEAAQGAAETAQAGAVAAQSKAEEAQAAAEQAKADAQDILDAVTDSANGAQTTADEALRIAGEAKTAAEGAVATANTAKSTADAAQATANAAVASISAGEGLKAERDGNAVTIGFDPDTVFVFDCGNASTQINEIN